MENHFELYLLALAGVAIHYIKDWVNHNKQGKKYGWQKALPTAVLSIITSLVMVYLRDDIKDLYVITPFSALIIGYVGNSLLFSFIDAKKPADV